MCDLEQSECDDISDIYSAVAQRESPYDILT